MQTHKVFKLLMTRSFGFFCALIFLSSCISLHKGEMIQTNFSSNKENFKIVKTIYGEANATYILGIGGNMKSGLIKEAKKNMYLSYDLKKNQNITNITTDVKKTYFIIPVIFMMETAFVSADIIEYYDNEMNKINDLTDIKPDIENRLDTVFNEEKELFNDNLKSTPYKNISEVKIGDKIFILTRNGFVNTGFVTKVRSDEVIEYKFIKYNGKYYYDESSLYRVRKCLQ